MNYLKKIFLLIGVFAVVNFSLFSQDNDPPGKKFEFEASIGMGTIKPESIDQRITGSDTLISQYASFYQLNSSSSGTVGEFKSLIPFNISANYFLGGKEYKWYLKAGVDYGSKSISSAKSYEVTWSDFNESHEYDFSNKISYLVPHVGIGIRYSAFDFYGALGLGFASFNFTEDYNYSEPGLRYNTTYDFQVKGTAPAFILGIKYRIKLSKKKTGLHAFLKLESMMLKVSTLEGSKAGSGTTPAGQRISETIEGTLYAFEWNPYGRGGFDYWDLFEGTGTGTNPEMRNYNKLELQLSSFRVMIGISF